jgi:hypothetical protein
MATLLHRKLGEQFFDSSGNPLNGGKLYFDQAGTTTDQTTYSNSAGTTPNTNPVVLDSAGRLTTPIYFGDSDSFSAYKETLTTSADVTVSPWPFDNIPAATPEESAATFASPLYSWTQVTSAASPVALTAADAGKAYEADTTSGNIEFDLPSAASVGDGKGFLFKKMVAGNSMVIDPSGSETIDNSSTSLTITDQYTVVGIFSNGAEWYETDNYQTIAAFERQFTVPTVQRFTSGTAQTYTPASRVRFIRVRMVGGGGGGGARATNSGGNGGTTSFGSWTAVGGTGGAPATGSAGGGGSGGTDGTGTLIARLAGADGGLGRNFNPTDIAPGASSVFGGGGAVRDNATGGAAKANTGSGGAGGGTTDNSAGGGGGAGEYVEFFVTSPSATTYTVGAAGSGGAAGTVAGGNGAAGIIIVEEYY